MSERRIIEAQLAKKTVEIQSLEEKLKVARIYVKAFEDVLKEISKGAPSQYSEGDVTLRQGSVVAQARRVILSRGTPIHVDDLLVLLGKEVTRETKASLTGSLAAYVRKGDVFTRPAPSTFGLIELEHFEEKEITTGPPTGFGQTSNDEDDEIPF